jgi:hypothetical protein
MLEGINVSSIAKYTLMSVFKATNYQWKDNASNGMLVDQYKNLGTKKSWMHTLYWSS